MVNMLSMLTAIAVYSRLCEMGQSMPTAVICGVAVGALARYAFKTVKKSAGAATPDGQKQ